MVEESCRIQLFYILPHKKEKTEKKKNSYSRKVVVVLRLMALPLRFLVVFLVAGTEEEVFWLNSSMSTGVMFSAVTHWLYWLL